MLQLFQCLANNPNTVSTRIGRKRNNNRSNCFFMPVRLELREMKYVGIGYCQDSPISETNAKGYTRYFEYDANGRLTEKTDRNGRVTTYTYDTAGRLTSESWLDSSNVAVNTFTYQYDLLGNLLTVNDGVSSYVYTYDTMNRIDSKIILFDAQMAVFSYTYDALGRQTESSLRLNGVQDRTINIEYDYLGRAISAELTGNALNDILAEFDYNAVGALTDVRRFEWDDTDELYNLIAQSQYQYNARNQITSIAHNNAAGNSIVSHGYLYNADGNISQYTNSLDGSVLYDYDFLGQLTGADYSNLLIHDESYQYDLNGNRELVTNANGDVVVYSTGTNNELTSDGVYTYAYDAEGNRISKTNAAGTERELYVWDYRNRLSNVTKQEYNATTQEWQTVQIVEYAYDYNNVLIRKVLDANGDGISDSKTLFLPENYQTAVQLDDADLSDSTDATVSHRYLWTPGQQDKLLADIQVLPNGSEILWTLTDHLGTIRDVVKNTPSGLVVPAHIIYDAYGNVLSCKDANGTDIESPVLFGFTGKYIDADTQLQNNVNRWYDSATGRWLSIDPIGFNGNDTNLYRYVGNRVLLFNDFLGNAGQIINTTERIVRYHIRALGYVPQKSGVDLSSQFFDWLKGHTNPVLHSQFAEKVRCAIFAEIEITITKKSCNTNKKSITNTKRTRFEVASKSYQDIPVLDKDIITGEITPINFSVPGLDGLIYVSWNIKIVGFLTNADYTEACKACEDRASNLKNELDKLNNELSQSSKSTKS